MKFLKWLEKEIPCPVSRAVLIGVYVFYAGAIFLIMWLNSGDAAAWRQGVAP